MQRVSCYFIYLLSSNDHYTNGYVFGAIFSNPSTQSKNDLFCKKRVDDSQRKPILPLREHDCIRRCLAHSNFDALIRQQIIQSPMPCNASGSTSGSEWVIHVRQRGGIVDLRRVLSRGSRSSRLASSRPASKTRVSSVLPRVQY